MNFVEEFRDPGLIQILVEKIHKNSKKKVRFMEFCGGHTIAIFKNGLRQLLPSTIEMVSGPGCPVCVTDSIDIDKAISLSKIPNVILTTFGDMLKVPGSCGSLQESKASGADIRMVYSPSDSLQIAKSNPDKSVIFLGIGFETTSPTIAVSILKAEMEQINNLYFFVLNKVCPPIIQVLLDSGEVNLDGLLCPGHVSAIIGSNPWEFIAKDFHIPCVVAGFEPFDILQCIDMLVSQVESNRSEVEISYSRHVTKHGNLQAIGLMDQVFQKTSSHWRGIGLVPDSGLKIRQSYSSFDATLAFQIETSLAVEPINCICGEILRGMKIPLDCTLFKTTCTPENPIGPCMVSQEGTCGTYYLYGEKL